MNGYRHIFIHNGVFTHANGAFISLYLRKTIGESKWVSPHGKKHPWVWGHSAQMEYKLEMSNKWESQVCDVTIVRDWTDADWPGWGGCPAKPHHARAPPKQCQRRGPSPPRDAWEAQDLKGSHLLPQRALRTTYPLSSTVVWNISAQCGSVLWCKKLVLSAKRSLDSLRVLKRSTSCDASV